MSNIRPYTTECKHVFHRQCFRQWYDQEERKSCPVCRRQLIERRVDKLPPGFCILDPKTSWWAWSTDPRSDPFEPIFSGHYIPEHKIRGYDPIHERFYFFARDPIDMRWALGYMDLNDEEWPTFERLRDILLAIERIPRVNVRHDQSDGDERFQKVSSVREVERMRTIDMGDGEARPFLWQDGDSTTEAMRSLLDRAPAFSLTWLDRYRQRIN